MLEELEAEVDGLQEEQETIRRKTSNSKIKQKVKTDCYSKNNGVNKEELEKVE